MMKTIPNILASTAAVIALVFDPLPVAAQYYYPPGYGYYYPPPPPPQRPRQQRPARRPDGKSQKEAKPRATARPNPQPEQPKPKPDAASPAARISKPVQNLDKINTATPPTADVSAISENLVPYIWDYTDTFAHLARAAGISTNQILALNNLTLSQLRDGQVLKVPALSNVDNLDLKSNPEQQAAREVWRGIRGKKRIALTFDAGGEPDGGLALLDHLQQADAPATFFVTGEFARTHPDMLEKMADAGHPVHNHSWSHPDFTKLSDHDILSQLSRADEAISSATGHSTKPYWRPPFGERNTRVLRLAAQAGYTSIYWTLDSLDSVDDKKSADFVIDRILAPPKSGGDPDSYLDGAIILMHVGEKNTAAAVPEVINQLRQRGFTLVTVDDILKP